MDEARGLLVAYAPALTNYNPSDPLITLTELFAYFTEVLLFRLNVVTDDNRIAFLRLLNGPGWQPPTPDALDAEVRRTVLTARQTDRAVTPEDFEFLALSLAADPQGRVARARCIPNLDLLVSDPALRLLPRPSHVSVVLVPFHEADFDPVSTNICAYLEPRRLLATKVHVVKANYIIISVQVTLHLLPDALAGDVKKRVSDALTTWFDPIVGGRDGVGWPFGRTVYVSEIYQLLDGIAGVDFATRTANADQTLNELLHTDPQFAATRLRRNDDGELIGIALDPDELVKAKINPDSDFTIVGPNP
jgi:hypothetical protein